MSIPTEPIGSIPRPPALIAAVELEGHDAPALAPEPVASSCSTVSLMARKYCVHGLPNTAAAGFKIPFAAGHTRRMPRLTAGPFRCRRYADSCLDVAMGCAKCAAMKQAVMYPAEGIATAFAKIRARVLGTALAATALGA